MNARKVSHDSFLLSFIQKTETANLTNHNFITHSHVLKDNWASFE